MLAEVEINVYLCAHIIVFMIEKHIVLEDIAGPISEITYRSTRQRDAHLG